MISTDRPSPLRLTLVTETFPPEVNGVARTLGRWVETFRARGHAVQVVRPRQPAEGPSPGCVYGLPLPYYPHLRFGVASPLRLRELLERGAPDLVHVATEGPLGWAALVAATSLGLPVATSFHTNFDQYLGHYGLGTFRRLLFAYLRWFHNRAAVTLVPSEATRRRLRADGVKRVAIWSRGVDARAFHPRFRDPALRRQLGVGNDGVLLVYVGRLAAEKNLSALLAAFARLRPQLPPQKGEGLRLALVGDGPLAGPIQALQTPGVVLAGQRHGNDLARWYASGDVFAFPSCSETFGNVVLEAQASGLPVVGFDVAPVNERVAHGVDGLLVPAGGDLAGALRLLCEDRGLRERFGAASRSKAELVDWQPIFDGLEARYRRLIAGNARRRAFAASGATWSRFAWTERGRPWVLRAWGSLFG
jgi:glycosyltransferase involved in cell wall biosynthesis